MTNNGKRKLLIIALSVVSALALTLGACAIYLGDYYRADGEALAAVAALDGVSVAELENGNVVFEPQNATAGFIFYPGGKVEHNAYRPLLAALAQEGVLCVLVEMPFNLAVFDVNAADGICEQYPEIDTWYIGGHSLGGSMAASYLASHTDEFSGLILLGSYSTADLSDTSLNVISIYGSEDGVLNREKYDENRQNLPVGFSETVIEGGNHAQFGAYGAQDKDGVATVGAEEQIGLTVMAIMEGIE